MIKSALIGRDISYTRSPEIHSAISEAIGIEMSFDVFDVPYDRFDDTAERLLREYDGFFITKPYKNDIKNRIESAETKCGVNFVRCRDAKGFNTDGIGFIRALDRSLDGWRSSVDSALVLGAGGAAFSVAEALINCGKRVYVLNRTMMTAVKMCTALGAEMYLNQPAELIVNATSLGLNNEDVLHSLCVLPKFEYAFDLVYSPPNTPFLRRNAAAGAKTANGEDMLIYQAIEGDRILTGMDFDVSEVYDKTVKILNRAGSRN